MGSNDLKLSQKTNRNEAIVELVETSLVPDAQNTRAYRDALGKFGTGVTVVTINGENGPIGMTANSFASVSLDPALVLWSLSKSSGRYQPYFDASDYAIHVLQENQGYMATGFAKNADFFGQCDWHKNGSDVPLINGTLARFECKQVAVHDAGDHVIIVGKVHRVTSVDGKPLLFAGGDFGRFETP